MALMSLNKEQQQRLLDLAKSSIQHGLQTGRPLKVNLADFPAELTEHRATFVTLHKHHQLRGCIGMLEAVRPLAEDIAENAFLAAFKDPRFPPLTADEFGELEIHLSILTPAEPVSFTSEQDLINPTTTRYRRLNFGRRPSARNLFAFGMGSSCRNQNSFCGI